MDSLAAPDSASLNARVNRPPRRRDQETAFHCPRMFMRLPAALTGLAGLALSFTALALTVPTPAAAGGLEDDWKACVAPGTAPAERIPRCDAAIASGSLKSAFLAQALTGRGFARALQKDFNAAISDLD